MQDETNIQLLTISLDSPANSNIFPKFQKFKRKANNSKKAVKLSDKNNS